MDENTQTIPVLFTGSSIIEYWVTLQEDMAPLNAVNRGMAGTRISQVKARLAGIMEELRPRAVVLYAGSNDIQGDRPPKAEYILRQFKKFVEIARESVPDIPVLYLSIAPSSAESRLPHIDLVLKTNAVIKEWCDQEAGLSYCDLWVDLADSDGKPHPACFLPDGIHFTPEGYRSIRSRVKKAVAGLI